MAMLGQSFNFDVDEHGCEFDFPIEIDGFDSSNAPAKAQVQTGLVKIKRYPRPNRVMYEYADEFAVALPDLSEGEAIYAIVSGNFIFGDFIEALMVRRNYFAEKITVATLSLGQENVDSLNNLVEGGFVKAIDLVVSDFWYAHERRREGGVPYIMDTLGKFDGFRFAAAGLHTKLVLIKTTCGKYLVAHGSANLRSSRNIEQVCVENNQTLYEFNSAWIDGIVADFQVNGKSKRAVKLWQALQVQTKRQG